MRNTSYHRGSHAEKNIPWKWISLVGIIIGLLVIVRIFGGGSDIAGTDYLTITPGSESSVYISMTTASKSRITSPQKLLASDKSVSVENGTAIAQNESMLIDLDRGTELSYISSSDIENGISLQKGRAWLQDLTKGVYIEMKNYTIKVPPGAILLIEQNGPYSNTYAIAGNLSIETSIGQAVLSPGNSISLLKSDILNPGTDITQWIRPIEGSIIEYPLFIRNNGPSLLGEYSVSLGSGSTSSGTIVVGGATGSLTLQGNESYIRITEPKSGILSKSNTITVMGDILSKEVKKVTINNIDATISPVNETFVLQGIPVTQEIFDIVYKAYDANGSILQASVLSIFGNKNSINSNSVLVPETFPLSTKDFTITFPTANPYSTTDRFIKVQGTVPKNTVDYIVVNDFRLQKFIPKSGTWYYFANMDTGTMTDGLNLYNIKFYKNDGTLLYTQPFTIIKESKNATVSGE